MPFIIAAIIAAYSAERLTDMYLNRMSWRRELNSQCESLGVFGFSRLKQDEWARLENPGTRFKLQYWLLFKKTNMIQDFLEWEKE